MTGGPKPGWDCDLFRQRLDEHHCWPALYTFKFIVPRDSAPRLIGAFEVTEGLVLRESSGGRYLSVTVDMLMTSSQDVVDVYQAVAEIPGLIAL